MQLSRWLQMIDSKCGQLNLFESQFVGGTKVSERAHTEWADCEAFSSVSNPSDAYTVWCLCEGNSSYQNNQHIHIIQCKLKT